MVHEVTGDSPGASNSATEPDAVTTVTTKRDVSGDVLDVRFAPHSFTLLEVQWPARHDRGAFCGELRMTIMEVSRRRGRGAGAWSHAPGRVSGPGPLWGGGMIGAGTTVRSWPGRMRGSGGRGRGDPGTRA